MKKIAFLSFYSGIIDRGVEIATDELVLRLSKNFDVTLFQAGAKSKSQIKSVKLLFRINEAKSTSIAKYFYLDLLSLKIALFTIKFLPYLFHEKYDIVIPTNGGWQVLICRIFTWVFRKKLIVQGNAGIGKDDLWQLFCKPDLYIAISPKGYLWAKSKFPKQKINYIPYGVDLKIFQNTNPIKLSLPRPIILCVSAFEKYKRIELLIRAITNIPDATLLLIGQGELEKDLRKLGEQLLNNRFKMLTNIDHIKLINYYKSADVFSLPSKSSEAFGIVYLEAMAAGLPIVATDDYNRRQIIGSAGILVSPENITEYAQAIKKALKTDFGNKPYQQAAKFSWESTIKKYISVLAL